MKCKLTVNFILNEEEADMAEIELESHLSDLITQCGSVVESFEIIESVEIEEDEEYE